MKKIIISLLVLSTLLLSCVSYASTYKFTATPDKTTVHPGDEVIILLKISDINAGSNGINVVETSLDYDISFFEKFEFIDKNDWKSTYNSTPGSKFGKLLYTKMITGVTQNEEIGILKFKLKTDLNEAETQIKLLQVTSNDGYELMNEGDKIITLKIVSETISVNPTPENPIPENSTTEQPSQSNQPNKSAPPKNVISNVQTGDIVGFIIAILLLVVLINIIIFIYSKRKQSSTLTTTNSSKNNNNKNN